MKFDESPAVFNLMRGVANLPIPKSLKAGLVMFGAVALSSCAGSAFKTTTGQEFPPAVGTDLDFPVNKYADDREYGGTLRKTVRTLPVDRNKCASGKTPPVKLESWEAKEVSVFVRKNRGSRIVQETLDGPSRIAAGALSRINVDANSSSSSRSSSRSSSSSSSSSSGNAGGYNPTEGGRGF